MMRTCALSATGILMLATAVVMGQDVDCMGSLRTLAVRTLLVSQRPSPTACVKVLPRCPPELTPRTAAVQSDLNSYCCNGGDGIGGGHRRAQAGDCAFTTCSAECSQLCAPHAHLLCVSADCISLTHVRRPSHTGWCHCGRSATKWWLHF